MGQQLKRRDPALWECESFHIASRSRCWVLRAIGKINRVHHTFSTCLASADSKLASIDLNPALRLFEESLIPTFGFVVPGSHEDAVLHDDDPNSDETVRFFASADANDFGGLECV